MEEKVYIAGFGGQGTLFIGQLLAHAGLKEGREVSFVPVYGVEKRGGEASCGVTVSDSRISSPIVTDPSVLVAMNDRSLLKYEKSVLPEGMIIVNGSLVKVPVKREDVRVKVINANEEAEALGDSMLANNIILGALVKLTGIVSIESVKDSLRNMLSRHNIRAISSNARALERGLELA